MYKMHRVEGKGERIPSERVSAVFKVNGKYPLREICPRGMEIHGLEGIHYSFPGEDRFTEETMEETAVRAAKQWGFDVEPRQYLTSETDNQRTAHFVLCNYLGSNNPIADEMTYENGRTLRLFSPQEALKHNQVKENNKRVIKQAEQL